MPLASSLNRGESSLLELCELYDVSAWDISELFEFFSASCRGTAGNLKSGVGYLKFWYDLEGDPFFLPIGNSNVLGAPGDADISSLLGDNLSGRVRSECGLETSEADRFWNRGEGCVEDLWESGAVIESARNDQEEI
jgi:hypothetical protein